MKQIEYVQNPKIVITKKTKEQLDNIKLVKSEVYDSVIVRIINYFLGTNKVKKSITREEQ